MSLVHNVFSKFSILIKISVTVVNHIQWEKQQIVQKNSGILKYNVDLAQ